MKKWSWKFKDNEVRIFNSRGTPMVHFSTEDLPSLVKYLTVVMQMNDERRKEIDRLRSEVEKIRNIALEEAAVVAESVRTEYASAGKVIATEIRKKIASQ